MTSRLVTMWLVHMTLQDSPLPVPATPAVWLWRVHSSSLSPFLYLKTGVVVTSWVLWCGLKQNVPLLVSMCGSRPAKDGLLRIGQVGLTLRGWCLYWVRVEGRGRAITCTTCVFSMNFLFAMMPEEPREGGEYSPISMIPSCSVMW